MKLVKSSIVFLLAFLLVVSNFGNFKATAATEELEVKETTPLFDEPNFLAKTGAAISNQTVEVLQNKGDGWYQIKTWLGSKWIAPEGVRTPLKVDVKIYNEPSYLSPTGASLGPQTLTVVDQRANGWWLVKTWLGERWIAPDGVKVKLIGSYPLYNSASFSSPSGASVANQTVTAIDQRSSGWWQIKTWLGNKWINTEAEDIDFAHPLKTRNYRVTSRFGDRGGSHNGIDLAAGGSIPIYASASGTVRSSTFGSPGNYNKYGNVVVVTHNIGGQTYETLYAHLSSRSVTAGQRVSQGQLLGYMGNTGESSGQHLHFEIHKGTYNAYQTNAVDPELYINF